jgi:hypothetical protein
MFYEGPPGTQAIPDDSINVPMQFSDNKLNRPFGFGWNLAGISGPNRVAYEPNIPTYYAGGNTVNFLTGLPYRPQQCPTISVQPDPYTKNGWLSDGPNLFDASGYTNGARSYTHKGLSKFGNRAGPQIILNTLPARLTEGRSDAAYANFGKRKKSYASRTLVKRPYHAKITLGTGNRISMKKGKKLSQKKTLDIW